MCVLCASVCQEPPGPGHYHHESGMGKQTLSTFRSQPSIGLPPRKDAKGVFRFEQQAAGTVTGWFVVSTARVCVGVCVGVCFGVCGVSVCVWFVGLVCCVVLCCIVVWCLWCAVSVWRLCLGLFSAAPNCALVTRILGVS